MAVYNGSDYLARSIQSILDQSVQPDEILVLDDGSTDGSAEIAQSFARVRVLRQPNGGIGAARRRLVEEASQRWIAFGDHDDWWEPNRLEAQIPFTADPNVTLIYGGVWYADEDGAPLDRPLHARPDAPSIDHLVPHPEDICSPCVLARRQSMLDAGNFNPKYRTGEDMLMWFRLGGMGKVVQVPQPLVHVTRRASSASSADRRQFEYAIALYQEEILPHLNEWYSDVDPGKLQECRRMLEEKVGFKMALLSNYLDRDGDRRGALELLRRALKLAPRSKGIWYRYFRSLAGMPLRPEAG